MPVAPPPRSARSGPPRAPAASWPAGRRAFRASGWRGPGAGAWRAVAAWSVRRRRAARAATRDLVFGHRDQRLGPLFQRLRFEQDLLFGRAIGPHHAAEIDQVGGTGALDFFP